MKLRFIVLLLSFLIIFSACGTSNQTGTQTEIVSGSGLEVSFRITSGDLINLRQVRYEINLRNSGKYPVTLQRNPTRFELITIQSLQNGLPVFEQESIEDFYDNIFDGRQELTLVNGAQIKESGVLFIEEDFFDNLNNDEIEYSLKISYDYRTDFNNNVELNLRESKMDVDRISQAAPIKITDITLQQVGREEYDIFYTLRNSGSTDNQVEIQNVDFRFGSQQFSQGSCEIFKKNSNSLVPTEYGLLSFSEQQNELILSCPLDINNYDLDSNVNTITSGEIEYEYTLREKGSVNLPDGRSIERR